MNARFTQHLQRNVFAEIGKMTDKQLAAEIENCHGLTDLNCGWLEFGLRVPVLDALENETRLRAERLAKYYFLKYMFLRDQDGFMFGPRRAWRVAQIVASV